MKFSFSKELSIIVISQSLQNCTINYVTNSKISILISWIKSNNQIWKAQEQKQKVSISTLQSIFSTIYDVMCVMCIHIKRGSFSKIEFSIVFKMEDSLKLCSAFLSFLEKVTSNIAPWWCHAKLNYIPYLIFSFVLHISHHKQWNQNGRGHWNWKGCLFPKIPSIYAWIYIEPHSYALVLMLSLMWSLTSLNALVFYL